MYMYCTGLCYVCNRFIYVYIHLQHVRTFQPPQWNLSRNEPISYKVFHFESLEEVVNLPRDYLSSIEAIEVSEISLSPPTTTLPTFLYLYSLFSLPPPLFFSLGYIVSSILQNNSRIIYCHYPFVLNETCKSKLVEVECRIQQNVWEHECFSDCFMC